MDVILDVWGFPELKSIFKNNHITDVECLNELLFKNHLDSIDVIPSAGVRMQLKKRVKEYIELNKTVVIEYNLEENNVEQLKKENVSNNSLTESLSICEGDSASSSNSVETIVRTSGQNDSFTSEKRIREADVDNHLLDNENFEFTSSQSGTNTKKRKIVYAVYEFNLWEALQNHPLGKAIINIYNHKKELCSTSQSYLCEIIVLHFLQFENFTLSNADFVVLRDKIIELFPLECPETYFVPPTKKQDSRKNQSERSKGKLVDKYRNKRTFIRESEHLTKVAVTNELKVNTDAEDAEKSKKWLVINRNLSEVINHWEITYCLRQRDAENEKYKVLSQIYENWPILKDSESYTLIELDFMKKCQLPFECFEIKWNSIFDKFVLINKKQLSKEDNYYIQSLDGCQDESQKDYKTYMQLKFLTNLLSTKGSKICVKNALSKKKTFWRPTKEEIIEGIVIHVKIPGDIENAIRTKRSKMSGMGLSLQPFIIIVGPNITQIQKVYVQIDAVQYELPCLLRAVDILFKIFIVFNVSYALESENFCYFLQWTLYELHTKTDTKIPHVYTCCNKLKKCL